MNLKKGKIQLILLAEVHNFARKRHPGFRLDGVEARQDKVPEGGEGFSSISGITIYRLGSIFEKWGLFLLDIVMKAVTHAGFGGVTELRDGDEKRHR